jgi:transmembrane sensor
MKKEELKDLFKKYHDGTCSEHEKALLESWYLQHNESGDKIIQHKINAAKNLIFLKLPGNESSFLRIGLRLAAAAVLIGIIFSVVFMLTDNQNRQKNTKMQADLPPGTNKAILFLANGRKLNLSDASNGKLLQNHGISVIKNKAGQVLFNYSGQSVLPEQNTISTPNGGQWQIRLPDGSQVWLNAASSLTFPTTFSNSVNRIVKLSGEGYFEIAKDSAHPFIVISDHQRVEVLGTHFNINSYHDEPSVKTTLLEGRVKVSLLGNNKPSILTPGEQAIDAGDALQIKQVDIEEVMAWKNGYFQFDDEPISSVMRKVARWYNIDVRYLDTINVERMNGRVSRNNNISQVIKALEATKTVHFKVEGRRVSVMK